MVPSKYLLKPSDFLSDRVMGASYVLMRWLFAGPPPSGFRMGVGHQENQVLMRGLEVSAQPPRLCGGQRARDELFTSGQWFSQPCLGEEIPSKPLDLEIERHLNWEHISVQGDCHIWRGLEAPTPSTPILPWAPFLSGCSWLAFYNKLIIVNCSFVHSGHCFSKLTNSKGCRGNLHICSWS